MESGKDGDYWIYPTKGLYDLWRHFPFPTLYPALQTAVTADVLEAGLIYAAAILAAAFIVILPGFRKSERCSTFVRIFISIFVLASLLLCNFGQDWEVSRLYTKTQYRAGLRGDINASVSVKIGLRSVNITLKGEPVKQMFENDTVTEMIDYNERLAWDNDGWTVGRAGFGPYAGKFNQEFREHQRKGSPYPILWIAEYFTLDGEGIRWGRHYLQAGYYTHIMLWTAFGMWILALVLFNMVLRYGGYASLMTGMSMIVANIIYATLRNPNQLQIPFEDGNLKFHWGWTFWLCIATGVLCIIIGLLVVILDEVAPEKLADFFNIDASQDLEEIYLDADEMTKGKKNQSGPEEAPESPKPGTSRYNVEMMEAQLVPQGATSERAYRKKSLFGVKRITLKPRAPPPIPVAQRTTSNDSDSKDYENTPSVTPTRR